jgi:hypothetical protein
VQALPFWSKKVKTHDGERYATLPQVMVLMMASAIIVVAGATMIIMIIISISIIVTIMKVITTITTAILCDTMGIISLPSNQLATHRALAFQGNAWMRMAPRCPLHPPMVRPFFEHATRRR